MNNKFRRCELPNTKPTEREIALALYSLYTKIPEAGFTVMDPELKKEYNKAQVVLLSLGFYV